MSLQSEISGAARTEDIHFTVTKVPRLYLLGQDAMIHLGVNILGVTYIKGVNGNKPVSVFKDLGPDIALQRVCVWSFLDFSSMCLDAKRTLHLRSTLKLMLVQCSASPVWSPLPFRTTWCRHMVQKPPRAYGNPPNSIVMEPSHPN